MPFEDFFKGEYPAVYRAAFLSTGSSEVAEDVTQEAFARAYARWKRLRNQPWAGGWVMRTAVNLCKKHHRLGARQPASEKAQARIDAPNEARVDLARELRKLPLRQRTAIVLFYLSDLPLPQIAHVMGISEGTVKAHLAQARSALRASMEASNV